MALDRPAPSDFPSSWMVALLRTAFPALSVDVPSEVLTLARQRHVELGEIVCTPDRPVEALTVVIMGSLRLDKHGHPIRNFGAGDYFGEGGLVGDAPPGVTISALEPTDLLQFPRDSLQRIIDTEPAFGVAFMQAILTETMRRLQATNELFADNRSLAQQLAQTVDRLDGTLAELQVSEERMRFLANHDPLTHIGNRAHLQDRLAAALRQARRSGRRFAVHMIDLDNFKPINDVHGHSAGDATLLMVAARLREITREVDTIARIGGDEFTVLQDLGETETAESVGALADRIIARLSEPFEIGDLSLQAGASIGIALYPEDGDQPDDLLRNGDLALYRAKSEGRGRCSFFTPALGAQALRFAAVKTGLAHAIGKGELSVHYQPVADLRSGRIIGAEALLRWLHPQHGPVSPSEFLPVAERSGLIGSLGAFVLREACVTATRWQDVGTAGFKLSVNLSPIQFRIHDVKALIMELFGAGFPAAALELDLSERALTQDSDDVIRSMRALQELGVSVAIDDFGTGSASLITLRRLAAETVKIDPTLVERCGQPSEAADVVRAIVDLARNFGMRVVAEGVETAEQLSALRRLGCDAAQGRLIASPLDATAFERFLAESRSSAEPPSERA
ncbi:MAG TPA: EAL domain-containing protein [Candidatus Sulfotelmatobacter sp.]|nr:EAL domain-containing protein [Candidatus Sulfotelmatobacter sp.]